ncbi:MAG: hypothetical protein KC620_23600, partial [Myxococcales bacterium]|nr:hypothetical protein [Myxococcales bacterium]
MRRLAAGLTLSTGLIAPLCAHADDFISPGLLMSFRDAPTDEERLGVGAEVSSSHWRGELFDGGLGWGGLLQCEFWLDGSVRIALGGQVHAPGLGTEVAWSLRHDDAGLHNGLQVGLFVGIGYANMAGRAIVEAQGLDYSGAMTVKLPYRLDGGGFYGPDDFFGDNITSGRPHRVAADRVWRPRVAVLGRDRK